ncbi:hypothetical protein FPV67DRAFT_1018570 [Lyophyllum atratum]|nr:hypothetical protein FPV67DRAFT_1018570 [Lyophyllum atratum]
METRNLPLRLLYTINSSPQYILARSSSSCPVILVPQVQTTSHYNKSVATEATPSKLESQPEFGTASLKTCLDAICRSSPELLQDFSRDFSVYVLDPLESNSAPAPVNISNQTSGSQENKASARSSEQPRGVAVGLGLMSWAMMTDEKDSAAVTGTLITLGTGQEALEVIFALRETAAMQKTTLPAALRSWGLPPGPSSKASRVHASKSDQESTHSPKASTYDASTSFSTATHSIAATSSKTIENPPYSIRYSIPNSTEPATSRTPSYLSQISSTADVTTLATIASIQMRSHQKRTKSKPKKPAKPPFINSENSEADRLLLSEDVYVGPVKKKGRPVNGAASGSGSNHCPENTTAVCHPETPFPTMAYSEESIIPRAIGGLEPNVSHTSSLPESQTRKAKSSKKSATQEPASLPFISTPLIRSPRDPEPPTLLDILAALSVSSSSNDPNVQNAALLAALNAIDSTPAVGSSVSEKTSNPALVNALRDLLSAVSQQGLPAPAPESSSSHPSLNTRNRNHLPDDDVVLLDKENVNPTAFRRRSERDDKLQAAESSSPSAGLGLVLGSVNDSPAHNRSLSTRSNGNSNTIPIGPAPVNSIVNVGTLRRKRTLSDVMDERESEKDKGKGRERELAERRDAHRHAHSSVKRTDLSANRHYPRLMSDGVQPHRRGTNSYYRTGMEPWTSPPRQKDQNSRQQPIIINDSPQAPRVSASSPVKPKPTQSHTRRRYVVPTWARTETSMQPRLSEEAQRAIELAEEKKREEKEASRKKGANRVEKVKKKQRVARTPSPVQPEKRSCQNEPTDTMQATQRPPSIAVASLEYPVFAMTFAIQDRIAAFSSPSTPSGSNSPRPLSSDTIGPPRTPPRRRHSDLFSNGEDGSLFTPMPKPRISDPYGSTNTPRHCNQRKVSMGSSGNGRRTPSPKAKVAFKDGNDASAEESEEDIEDALNRELDTVLNDLDMPSSSLPAASSDVDMDEGRPNVGDEISPMEDSRDDEEDGEVEPPKQHWVGLPPSSPPPPTSPILTPQDEEYDALSDDMELPAATSDTEPWPTDYEATQSSFSEHELSACADEELSEYLQDEDFRRCFLQLVTTRILGAVPSAGWMFSINSPTIMRSPLARTRTPP